MRFFNLILVVAIIGLSVLLYDIKYRAELADKQADKLERNIAEEQEGIRVLRAEWSYLNQPERLQELATRYTHLKTLAPVQISNFDAVPMPRRNDEFYAPAGREPLGGYAGLTPRDLGKPGSSVQ
ncbi:MAG: hypothetical protein WBN97_06890 [Parvibaculum sp.]